MEYSVAPSTEAGEVVQKFHFSAAMVVGPVMRLEVMLAVADLAAVAGAGLNGVAHFLPIVRCEVIIVVVAHLGRSRAKVVFLLSLLVS